MINRQINRQKSAALICIDPINYFSDFA